MIDYLLAVIVSVLKMTSMTSVWMPVKVLVTQLCLILCNPVDCSPPGSSVHGVLQARMLKCVAIPFPGDCADPGFKPKSPAFQADSLLSKPPGKPYGYFKVTTFFLITLRYRGNRLPSWLTGEESACNAGDVSSIPGSGRCAWGGNGNTFQYSCLENPMDREAWQATVHEVAQSQTWLSIWAHTQEYRSTTFFLVFFFSVFLSTLDCCAVSFPFPLLSTPGEGNLRKCTTKCLEGRWTKIQVEFESAGNRWDELEGVWSGQWVEAVRRSSKDTEQRTERSEIGRLGPGMMRTKQGPFCLIIQSSLVPDVN